MKKVLILAVFLLATSFSFVGCSDDPVESITGPSTLDIIASDLGLPDDRHFDLNNNGFIVACPAGYHRHVDGDDLCRNAAGYDTDNLDINRCYKGGYCLPDEET